MQPDESEITGLDPFDALDQAAARLDSFMAGLSGAAWDVPSACAGWSVRDVMAHLASGERYHQACLDGRVSELLAEMGERGATDVASFNDLLMSDVAGRSGPELLEDWRVVDAETRRRFRERGDGMVDTSVGDYPNRLQAFHIALELATHADDVGAPPADGEREWRTRFSRFALAESKPELVVAAGADGRTRIEGPDGVLEVDDDVLIAGVAARLSDDSELSPEQRDLLSTMP